MDVSHYYKVNQRSSKDEHVRSLGESKKYVDIKWGKENLNREMMSVFLYDADFSVKYLIAKVTNVTQRRI